MKEKWRLAAKVALILFGALLLLYVIGFGRHFLSASQVDKMTLTAWDGDGVRTVELSDAEIFGFAAIYSLSRYAGEVDAEGCSIKFCIRIYLNNGDRIRIDDHKGARMEVSGIDVPGFWLDSPDIRDFWIDNPLLLGYIRFLVTSHGLKWETWHACDYGC